MKIKELIAELQKCDPEAMVNVTWEGTTQDIASISVDAKGIVWVDADAGFYLNPNDTLIYSDPERPWLKEKMKSHR